MNHTPSPKFHESQVELEAEAASQGLSALMAAAAGGQLDRVQELIEAGQDVNKRSPAGATAMIYAARNDHSKVVEALLAAGGDPYIQTDLAETAESIAWKFDSKMTINVLQKHKATLARSKPNTKSTTIHMNTAADPAGKVEPARVQIDPLRKVIYAGIATALLLVFFPPHVRPVAADAYAGVGFAFIFNPPSLGNGESFALVNVPLLALLLIVVATLTAVFAWLVRENAA
jgi:hypothetical protein